MMLVFLFLTFLLGVSQAELLGEEEGAAEVKLAPPPDQKCRTADSKCESYGGNCYWWTSQVKGCEYREKDLCHDDECMCCIDCDKDFKKTKCHEVDGACRKDGDCYSHEYTEDNFCLAKGCTCCRECDTPLDCENGVCVKNIKPYLYRGYFVNEDVECKQKECSCVQKCKMDKRCMEYGGYCVNQEIRCMPEYARFECGCGERCACCVPRMQEEEAIANFVCINQ